MKLTYPIVLIPFRDGSGGYTVEIPDLPGCVTEGRDLAEALFMAQDAASGWVLTELKDGKPIPTTSNLTECASSRSTWTHTQPNTAGNNPLDSGSTKTSPKLAIIVFPQVSLHAKGLYCPSSATR